MTPEVALFLFLAFAAGLVVGCLVGEAGLKHYLRQKANPLYRDPAKLGDGFFYIVPEAEYVEMRVRQATAAFPR